MILEKWENIPLSMQKKEVFRYYEILSKKKCSLVLKRIFDVLVSSIMLIVFSPVFLVLAIAIKAESEGPVFYRQERVTKYGRHFRIFKFRTMVANADEIGAQITVDNDSRITKVGKIIRKYRLDEICQLIDILRGTMTFVGTRPEVPKYVEHYSDEMLATLLLPAGVTSKASIFYKDEDKIIGNAANPDEIYINEVLPGKMYYNLKGIEEFSFISDIKIMFMTVFAVFGKEYKGDYVAPVREKV